MDTLGINRSSHRWLQMMLVAFFFNGLGPFGLKILAEKKLSVCFHDQYLVFWYLGGFALTAIAALAARTIPSFREFGIASGMGLFSFAGQLCTALALERGIPGYIAFSVTTGGSLFLVAVAGRVFFREKIGIYGLAGVLVGVLALVALSIP
jgi:drug/metabolite transporter (DMT)-like permease